MDRGPTTSAGPSLGPSLAREAVGLEGMKKVAEKIRETTMNAGVVARMSVRDRHRSCKAQPSVDSPPPLVRCGNYFPCAEEESLNYEKNGETKGERPTNDRCGGKKVITSIVRWVFPELEDSMLNADASVTKYIAKVDERNADTQH